MSTTENANDKSIRLSSKRKLSDILVSNPKSPCQFLFVGGKGGVGKTSSSSAISVACSDRGLKTLIVSTDPAHSLGDALDVDLSSGHVVRVPSEDCLFALEVDVEEAMRDFNRLAEGFDSERLSVALGIPRGVIESLGISDLTSIFTNPPPGIDEVVALISVFKYADLKDPGGNKPLYDRIIIDTAPTGHTLRLLQLPLFLSSVTAKLLNLRNKLTSLVSSFSSFFQGGTSAEPGAGASASMSLLSELESFQARIQHLKVSLRDPDQTQFAIVTIPTQLAVAESARLLTSLQGQGIGVASVICNQVIAQEHAAAYLETRRRAQRRCVGVLSEETSRLKVALSEVAYVDTEVTGIYGLRYFASLAHPPLPRSPSNPMTSRKLTVLGGKGGVGKTSAAASWAVQLSDSGFRTLVVSTDPAHSLGDAFSEALDGAPRRLDLGAYGSGAEGGGELWAMEIDPVAALEEFKAIIEDSLPSGAGPSGSTGGLLGGLGLDQLKEDLKDILTGVSDPPPGTDEIVALVKVVRFLEAGYKGDDGRVIRFDRVVLDTAPTGHTLRMLELPPFLKLLVQKLKTIRSKAGSLGGMFGAMDSSSDNSRGVVTTSDKASTEDRLGRFEEDMDRLERILHSAKDTEFVVVTIPTDLATAETTRLLRSLSDKGISVRRVIMNQMIPERKGANDALDVQYLDRLRKGQASCMSRLQQLSDGAGLELIKVPYFDTEVRTVYGLRALSLAIFSHTDK